LILSPAKEPDGRLLSAPQAGRLSLTMADGVIVPREYSELCTSPGVGVSKGAASGASKPHKRPTDRPTMSMHNHPDRSQESRRRRVPHIHATVGGIEVDETCGFLGKVE
jgi:hypothetical protein